MSTTHNAYGLSTAKRALLGKRLRGELRGACKTQPTISRIPEHLERNFLDLSFTQQRLWFLSQIEPDSPFYNVSGAARLLGSLDVSALTQALNTIVSRHEILRTTFATAGWQPVQVIAPSWTLEVPIIDLTEVPAASQEAVVREIVSHEARSPMSLSRGPLTRVSLVRLAALECVLILTMHHIISDGWSFGVFFRELAVLYDAYSRNVPAHLSELPVQYADFAYWQRQWLSEERLESQFGYWKKQLGGDLPVVALPSDYPRPASQSFKGATYYFALPDYLTERLEDLSQSQEATLFMTGLAAFLTLIHRYTQQEDLTVGSPLANRGIAETQNMIGLFVNMLALRTSLHGNPSFKELLERVKEVTLDAQANEDVPLEKLVEILQPDRDLSWSPLFQVVFSLQDAPTRALTLPGLTIEPLEVDTGTAKFDLILFIWRDRKGLSASLEYSTDLFTEATIIRMAGHFQALLQAVVDDPGARISDLSILPESERRQIVSSWNDTERDYARNTCMHHLFENQVERAPDLIAATFENEEISYEELNRRSNQLARHLMALGVGPGDMVAVYLNRCIEMIPALMAILKAGAAYVPLEVSFPKDRIQWVMGSLNVRCVITQTWHLTTICEIQQTLPCLREVICLDSSQPPESLKAVMSLCPDGGGLYTWADLSRCPEENASVEVSSEDLAYIVFTSGSTGTPKGVMVRHQPVVNLIEWVNRTFSMDSADRVLFITSLCFDLSVYDIFGILAAGGSIRIASEADIRDPELLLSTMCAEPITFWDSAPAALQQLVPFLPSSDGGRSAGDLRLVFLSGDWIPVSLPDAIRGAFTAARVIGLGGATEATVWSNYYPIEQVDPKWMSIPYGKPIQNSQYRTLDSHLNPCPVVVPGDLYIGGECLCSGYANEAALTASKFIPDPFSDKPGSRLYRTGDLARYFSDGNLEFLGRADCQVKIRGFRIELGEIESVLSQQPGVQEAVVIAREDTPGDRRLVAYVVPAGNSDLVGRDLRSRLKETLPEYMIPTAFIPLDSMPITANGKLNRKALPAPDRSRSMDNDFVAPRTAIEEAVAAIWREVLGVDQIGVNDNFFDLGGHSLLATQVASRLRDSFQIELPLRRFFENPTTAAVASQIDAAGGEHTGNAAGRIKAQPRGEKEIDQLLAELERLSEDEAFTLLTSSE